ncbi:MAG: type III-B CRISPR-associated protein Cas10/Cmr2, partial [Candidatus Hadarchaeales archaeon]
DQFSMPEQGRKCSVCGERDVVFFRESMNKKKFTRYDDAVYDLTENANVTMKFLSDKEGLCSVCFLKRTFEIYLQKKVSTQFKNYTFPSTAEVATADFRKNALQNAAKEFEKLRKTLKKHLKGNLPICNQLPKIEKTFGLSTDFDSQLLYEENLTPKYFSKEIGVELDGLALDEIKSALKTIIDIAGHPSRYYAIVHFDGDNMGKWLSGELLPEIEYSYNSRTWKKISEIFLDADGRTKISFAKYLSELSKTKILTPAIHAAISTALKNYSLEFVKNIIEEEHLGNLIYAGGDDVLAFVNLSDLLDVIQKLRWAFSGQIRIDNGRISPDLNHKSGFVEKNNRLLLTMGCHASGSIGVVIAHYKMPLQIAINEVFKAEKIAKESGKDSFAICLLRRSGEKRLAVSSFLIENNDVIEIIKSIAEAFNPENENGFISKSFIYKFTLEFERLKLFSKELVELEEIFTAELLRLLKRSYVKPKKRIKSENVKNLIENIWQGMKEILCYDITNIENFINLCIIADFLHSRGK